jgi:hypothetical protein
MQPFSFQLVYTMLFRQIMNETKPNGMLKTIYLIVLAGIFTFSGLSAQDQMSGRPMPLFQSDDVLYLDLQSDFKEVFLVNDDSTYFPARITLTDNAGLKRTLDIKVRTRGKTRRDKDICSFPPLRLNFAGNATENTPFYGQKALKLVTHCNKPGSYEQNTVMEYLIYRIYNVLTDSSFRVRPAVINYIYADKEADSVQKFAFFIEREKFLADRLNGIETEAEKVHPDRLDPMQTCLVDVFEYMIGNTDYSIYGLHNIMLLSDPAEKLPPAAIPYDFDWSGLVSAVYAEPNPLMNTESVTGRVYRGLRKEPEIVYNTIRVFNLKKDEIYRLINNFDLLDQAEKKKAIRYLDDFYWIINNERVVKTEFFDRARIEDD